MKYFRFVIFVLVFLSSTAIFADEEPSVEIIYVSGSAGVRKAYKTTYIKAEEGMLLQTGDEIKTAQDSSLELSFDENNENVVRIESNADVVLLLKENEKIELLQGEVFSTISKLASGSSFEIRTPTAIAGARGTDWVTKVEEESTVIEAIEGDPYVKGIEKDGKPMAEETIVLTGHMTAIKRFQKPEKLKKLLLKNRKRWKALKVEVRKHAEDARLRRKKQPQVRGLQDIRKEDREKRFEEWKPPLKEQIDKKRLF